MNKTTECNMVILEDGDLNDWWECSHCYAKNKGTRKFEESKECPSCGSTIVRWVGMDDDDYPE